MNQKPKNQKFQKSKINYKQKIKKKFYYFLGLQKFRWTCCGYGLPSTSQHKNDW